MDFMNKLSPIVHWGLRLSLAATFIYHGLGKFPVEQTAAAMGMPSFAILLIGLVEIIGGVCLIAGALVSRDVLTRIGGLCVIVIMVGAIGLVHAKNGWDVMKGGMEFQVLMLAVGLYFAAKGNEA
jgi:putative oxidoreductase